jgi:hypothetical protein
MKTNPSSTLSGNSERLITFDTHVYRRRTRGAALRASSSSSLSSMPSVSSSLPTIWDRNGIFIEVMNATDPNDVEAYFVDYYPHYNNMHCTHCVVGAAVNGQPAYTLQECNLHTRHVLTV